jgi:hypothetical protein
MSTINQSLRRKIQRVLGPGTSGKFVAILGCILNERWTNPRIAELYVTSDNCVLARHEGDIGANEFIGGLSDVRRNCNGVATFAGLTLKERAAFSLAVDSALTRS